MAFHHVQRRATLGSGGMSELEQQKHSLQEQQVEFENQLFPKALSKQSQHTRPRTEREVRGEQERRQHESVAKSQQRPQRRGPSAVGGETVSYLYDTKQSHPVIEYLPSKADAESGSLTPSFVLEVTWPRVVQLYHPSSPHCQALQPTYVALARGLKRRSSRLPVEFHAVNCGAHRGVCEEGFRVARVPTVVVLQSGRIEWTEVSLPGSTADAAVAAGSPDAARDDDIDVDIEYLAQELDIPLDAAKGHAGAAFARPAVDRASERAAGDEPPREGPVARSIPIADQVYYDATSSLLATLASSLYSPLPPGSALSHDTASALVEMLDLIRWAFPPETPLHDLAEDLKLDFASVRAGEEGLTNILRRHAPAGRDVRWSPRCQSRDGGGGYSCGLWTLLHVLSVGVAERHTSVVGGAERVSVSYAGRVLRSFIAHFFVGCRSCRELWLELYDEVVVKHRGEEGWDSLAIWMWEVHNEITVRRQRSAGTGHYHPQLRMASSSSLWPPKEECPKCWASLTDDTGLAMSMDSYDRAEVFGHLKKAFWPRGVHNNRLIVLDKAKRLLSMQRLRARMAAHDWHRTVLAVHVLVACVVLRMACPRSRLGAVLRRTRMRGRMCRTSARRKKRTVTLAERSRPERRTPPTDDISWNSPYVRNKSRPTGHASRSRPSGRRRYYTGSSGSLRSAEHQFDYCQDI